MKINKQEYLELLSDLAEWHVEETVINPWEEDMILGEDPSIKCSGMTLGAASYGVYTYTDEAQEAFIAATDAIDFVLTQYLEIGE